MKKPRTLGGKRRPPKRPSVAAMKRSADAQAPLDRVKDKKR